MEEEELQFYKDNRKYARSKVTQKCNSIDSSLDNLTQQQCNDEKAILQNFKFKLDELNANIARGLWVHETDRSVLNKELDVIDQYDEAISRALGKLETRIKALITQQTFSAMSVPNVSTNVAPGAQGHLRLPQVPLPEYSHTEGENLSLFFNNFEGVIDKFHLSEYEKFVLLEKQLKNEPAVLIKSLQGSKRSYSEAKDLLTRAFASKFTQSFDIIAKMSNLKLPEGKDPYTFLSDVRIIIDTFRTLNIDVDTVMTFFIWQGMPESLRTEFIHINNTCKPTLQQIDKSMFEAAERYVSLHTHKRLSKSGGKEHTTGLAVNINNGESSKKAQNFKSCSLCTVGDRFASHAIYKCPNYGTNKLKIAKLKEIGACVKCSGNSHKTHECRFKFNKPCYYCQGQHFSFLCFSRKNEKSQSKDDSKTVQSGAVTVECEALSLDTFSPTILPTFTCKLKNGQTLRALKDSGCQSTFLRKDVAFKNELKTVRKIKLSVKGFNAVQNYETEVIEVSLRFGKTVHKIHAILVPSINSSLSLPGLSTVVKTFKDKGYYLADKYLLNNDCDEICNFDLLLGMSANYCLPEETVLFGKKELSTYSDTPIGIMLMGNIATLMRNLVDLPSIKDNSINFQTSISEDAVLYVEHDVASEFQEPKVVNTESLQFPQNKVSEPSLIESVVNFCNTQDYCVLDDNGEILTSELEKAVFDNMFLERNSHNLQQKVIQCLDYDLNTTNEICKESDQELVEFALNTVECDATGRLVVPILWDHRVSHLLSDNFNLAKKILECSLAKREH